MPTATIMGITNGEEVESNPLDVDVLLMLACLQGGGGGTGGPGPATSPSSWVWPWDANAQWSINPMRWRLGDASRDGFVQRSAPPPRLPHLSPGSTKPTGEFEDFFAALFGTRAFEDGLAIGGENVGQSTLDIGRGIIDFGSDLRGNTWLLLDHAGRGLDLLIDDPTGTPIMVGKQLWLEFSEDPSKGLARFGTGTLFAAAPMVGRRPLQPGEAGAFHWLNSRRVTGDRLSPHHMPQAALKFTSRAEGGSIALPEALHAQTRTFGWRGARLVVEEAGLPFRTVLYRDIMDLRGITGKTHNRGLLELLDYYRTNFPHLFAKP